MKRKILTLILALSLVMGLAVPAFATADPPAELKKIQSVSISLPNAKELVMTLGNICDSYMLSKSHKGYQDTYMEFPQYTFFYAGSGTFSSNKSGIGEGEYTEANGTPWGGGSAWFEANQPLVIGASTDGKEYLSYFSFDIYSDGLPETPSMVGRENSKTMYKIAFINLGSRSISDWMGSESSENVSFHSISELTGTGTTEQPSAWAESQVNAAISSNLVPEALQVKYAQAATRADFCALAVAVYESVTKTTITERKQFNDTNDVNVQKMGALGVVTGVGNGNFSPDTKLTREQAAVMLARLAEVIGKPLAKESATFSDTSTISSWALESVGQIQVSGIMNGVGNNMFAPQNPYSREQSIITILRLYEEVK